MRESESHEIQGKSNCYRQETLSRATGPVLCDPQSGPCPCYNVGDEFIFERDEKNDHFWHGGLDTLVKTSANPDTVAGGPKMPHCSEAWDAIARYIYTGLQGGSIMRGWMKEENTMIACCSDGTRPVIFKIERLDEED